jgi:hypothetical protein
VPGQKFVEAVLQRNADDFSEAQEAHPAL